MSVLARRHTLGFASIAVIFACVALAGQARADQVIYSQGFETNNSGWDVFGGTNDATRVPSGTNGITSASGSFHALAAGPNNGQTDDGSAATNWGGYSSVFGLGFKTSLDIYLKFGTTNDTRFDWDSAVNYSSGNFRRDFVFNGGFYNNTDATGSGDRFVFSASNNATRSSSFPENPGRDPFAITTEGWYTFQDRFYDNGGVLAVDLSILDSLGTILHTWTLSNPLDLIATTGGNRYAWVVFNEFSSLAIDNAELTRPTPEPATIVTLAAMGVTGLVVVVRRRRQLARS